MHGFVRSVRRFHSRAHNYRTHDICTGDNPGPEHSGNNDNDKLHTDTDDYGSAGIRSDPPPVGTGISHVYLGHAVGSI